MASQFGKIYSENEECLYEIYHICKRRQTCMTFDFNRIPWKDVVAMAADVARNGFNVTHDFGKYRVIYRTNCLV